MITARLHGARLVLQLKLARGREDNVAERPGSLQSCRDPSAGRQGHPRRNCQSEANIPFLDHPGRPLPQSILRLGLAAAGTQLIVLDEIHNIEHVRGERRVLLRDYVRCLSNETQLPIVLAGTEEFERAIHEVSGHRTRFLAARAAQAPAQRCCDAARNGNLERYVSAGGAR
jgi:Bacterial TniB protein